MKKILILSAVCIFTLSSFSPSEKIETLKSKQTTTKMVKYNYKCKNGNYGSFYCDGGLDEAWQIANTLCSM